MSELVRPVRDFPKPGIDFKDITPLLGDASGFASCIDELAGRFEALHVDKVLGIEARGFIIAAPVALRLGAGFVPVRKVGKLPGAVYSDTYDLEYGTETLEVHRDSLEPGESVLIVDDVLATGGTAAAARRLVEQLGGRSVGFACVLEIVALGGQARLEDLRVEALLSC